MKSPAAPPRAPNPKRLSATRAACESRTIGFPFKLPLDFAGRICAIANYTAVRHEPDMKTQTRFGSIDDRSVGKSTIAAAGLFRLRNGIHLRPGGTVLVRGGSGAVADAARWRRLPVPRLLAEVGDGCTRCRIAARCFPRHGRRACPGHDVFIQRRKQEADARG